jgi:hypothetical protein
MQLFTFELIRTYSTTLLIDAETQEDAIVKFNALGDEIYRQELEQCNIVFEAIKGDKYARKCDKCGKGMNDGYVIGGGDEYYCTYECLNNVYTTEEWVFMADDDDSDEGFNYWTEWDDAEDYQYQIINGILEEIN